MGRSIKYFFPPAGSITREWRECVSYKEQKEKRMTNNRKEKTANEKERERLLYFSPVFFSFFLFFFVYVLDLRVLVV
jgi:hypothetical protein